MKEDPAHAAPSLVVRIPAHTRLGAVHLIAANLDRLVGWYEQFLGLQLHRRDGAAAHLGAGNEDLLVLTEMPSGRRHRGTTGLYHFAILLPARRELARAIARLAALGYPNYPTDHVMTETTYLDDPEGNGIELYVDTPEDGTFSFADGQFITRDAYGNLRSGRDPLDLSILFRELPPDDPSDWPLPVETKVGHVHLHVADLAESVRFYHDKLGFDTMGIAPAFRAAFVSAGGYHHHIGLNTWAGEGATAPPADALGLRYFAVVLPSRNDLADLAQRLSVAGVVSETRPEGILVYDPSQNGILLTTRPSPSAD